MFWYCDISSDETTVESAKIRQDEEVQSEEVHCKKSALSIVKGYTVWS